MHCLTRDLEVPAVPEVLRCTRGGTIVGRSTLEEACGEAMDSQSRGGLLKALQGMNYTEKLHLCKRLKDQGNAHYASGEYAKAIALYEQGLLALDFGTSEEQEADTKHQLLLPLLLNLCACLLKMRSYAKARAVCNVALDVNPHCLKALYRRGLAEKELGELDAATRDFRKVLVACEKHRQSQQMQKAQRTQRMFRPQQGRAVQNAKHALSQRLTGPLPPRERPCSGSGDKPARSDDHSPASLEEHVAAAHSCENSGSEEPWELLARQCRRQVAIVRMQERRYRAACLRMFKAQPAEAQEKRVLPQEQGSSQQEPCTGICAWVRGSEQMVLGGNLEIRAFTVTRFG
ncbi:tetratricopeptide repeat-containing protein [Cyclospora cayetanensis]|uniref:Tetratricopeptide repeat-containing protein n=1 Tax=Cyclospora cayetanensis TaxID=88456 RepID=A0A1D3D8U8_9EIME|nr:tetratricopeptide repeat-containing protein [Cyclospora cayetanensis]